MALTAIFLVLAQFTHTIGLAIPLVLFIRLLAMEKERRGTPFLRGLWAVGGLLALAVLCQLLPRVLLPDAPGALRTDLTVGKVAAAVWLSLGQSIVPGIVGEPGSWSRPFLLALCGGLLLLWGWGRKGWRIALMGVALALAAWVLPFLFLGYTPERFAAKFRYMLIPNLGFAFCWAALLENLGSTLGRVRGGWRFVAPAVFSLLAVLFLAQTWGQAAGFLDSFRSQDSYISQVATRYRETLPKVLSRLPCPRITIVDAKLMTRRPAGLSGTILIQELNHEKIHRFYFGGRPGLSDKIAFQSYNFGMEIPVETCTFLALEGSLVPSAEARQRLGR